MYATDFGTLPPPMELQGDATWHVVDAAVAWCTAAGDHDLVAELLFTQLLLRRRLSAYGVVAWHRSRDVWDALGFLPSPSLSAETFASLQGVAEQCQYAHNSMYHTVLVGGLVCAALLGAPVTAPDAEPGTGPYEEPTSVNRAVEGAVAHLVRLLGVSPLVAREVIALVEWTADDARVHALAQGWQADHVGAAAPTRMAIDASIILAAQGYDLPQLAAALRHAARTGTATPTVLAGADFLGRQMLVEGAIGAGWLEQGPEPPVGSDTALAAAGATAALANCLGELGIHLSRREEALG
jgi:hypothetical protein